MRFKVFCIGIGAASAFCIGAAVGQVWLFREAVNHGAARNVGGGFFGPYEWVGSNDGRAADIEAKIAQLQRELEGVRGGK